MATDLETNKATVRQFFGAVERRDFKVFDQIVVENYAHNIQDMPIGRPQAKRQCAKASALGGGISNIGSDAQRRRQAREIRHDGIVAAIGVNFIMTGIRSELPGLASR
jgi:hypothetical protein